DIQGGDTVAVWGCGAVGQFAIQSAFMLGAERVIAIDRFPERLRMAKEHSRAEVINYEEVDVLEALKEMTGGFGPDACIDAVGMEAHGTGVIALYDKVKQAARLETDRPLALREMIQACRKGGTVSVAGVYGGFIDKVPFGAAFNKGLTFKMGQTHVHKYLRPLLEKIEQGDIDPSFIVTHRVPLEEAPQLYKTFTDKEDGCIKVVLKP
ncbi:MAG: zinc-binding dehydrogenase, partial [Deinococcota bacterium]|nr:zinc-binding dehydrogenase [Deinococcota bacterium]